jgi:hypothetical protein
VPTETWVKGIRKSPVNRCGYVTTNNRRVRPGFLGEPTREEKKGVGGGDDWLRS